MQTELLTLISDSCTADNAGVPDGHEPDGSAIVVALQQQLDTIIEDHIKLDNPQDPAYRDLLHDVSVACASALGKLSACDQAVLSAMLTDQFSEECSMVPQARYRLLAAKFHCMYFTMMRRPDCVCRGSQMHMCQPDFPLQLRSCGNAYWRSGLQMQWLV